MSAVVTIESQIISQLKAICLLMAPIILPGRFVFQGKQTISCFLINYMAISVNMLHLKPYFLHSISTDHGISVKACSPDCGHDDACVKKCCPLGQVYRYDLSGSPFLNGTCVDTNDGDKWSPHFSTVANYSAYSRLEFGNILHPVAAPTDPYYFLWKPKCKIGHPVKYGPHPKMFPSYSVELVSILPTFKAYRQQV